MPYISKDNRPYAEQAPLNVGELTYAITRVCLGYLDDEEHLNFEAIGQVIAALEASKLEFYRRVVAPYEDVKKVENGDVYKEDGYWGSYIND